MSDAVRLTLALAQASTAVEFRELVRRHPEWRSDDFRLDLLMGIESLRAHAQQREAAIRLERLLALLDDCRAWGIEETLASEFENSLAAALPPELAQHLGSLRHSPAVDTGAWDKFLAGPDVARCPPELRNELRNAMGAHHLKRYRATRDAKAEVSGSVLVVADPTEPDCPLPNAAREANAVAASFSSALILSGAQATRTRVLDELARHDILHFACHGRADLLNPLDSGLALAGGERLTLDDVLLARLDVRLAVLSACETALPGARLPDEVVGLPTGLVQAGAIGVIGSLWSVPDMVTAELMTRFYAAWRCGGMEPAEALRQAQQSVRDDPNHAWSHPFYWAAFCYHGA